MDVDFKTAMFLGIEKIDGYILATDNHYATGTRCYKSTWPVYVLVGTVECGFWHESGYFLLFIAFVQQE